MVRENRSVKRIFEAAALNQLRRCFAGPMPAIKGAALNESITLGDRYLADSLVNRVIWRTKPRKSPLSRQLCNHRVSTAEFFTYLFVVTLGEIRMRVRVIAEFVTFSRHAPHQFRILFRPVARKKNRDRRSHDTQYVDHLVADRRVATRFKAQNYWLRHTALISGFVSGTKMALKRRRFSMARTPVSIIIAIQTPFKPR